MVRGPGKNNLTHVLYNLFINATGGVRGWGWQRGGGLGGGGGGGAGRGVGSWVFRFAEPANCLRKRMPSFIYKYHLLSGMPVFSGEAMKAGGIGWWG